MWRGIGLVGLEERPVSLPLPLPLPLHPYLPPNLPSSLPCPLLLPVFVDFLFLCISRSFLLYFHVNIFSSFLSSYLSFFFNVLYSLHLRFSLLSLLSPSSLCPYSFSWMYIIFLLPFSPSFGLAPFNSPHPRSAFLPSLPPSLPSFLLSSLVCCLFFYLSSPSPSPALPCFPLDI